MNATAAGTAKKHWVTLSMIQGHLAMWAVRQSPYHNPSDLGTALELFRCGVRHFFDENEMAEMSSRELAGLINGFFLVIPQVRAWNERKNRRSGIGFVSRYDKPNPDDDFIDLDALRMNAVRSVFQECEEL